MVQERDHGESCARASSSLERSYDGSGPEGHVVCAGDTALDPSASALAYGTASRVGGSECVSRTDGVTCVNRSGHGFFISVQSYQVF